MTKPRDDDPRCVCGHLKHEHDRAFPTGESLGCCRRDVGCMCDQFRESKKETKNAELKAAKEAES